MAARADGLLLVADLVHVDAWLAREWPAMRTLSRARIAARLVADHRGKTLTPDQVAALVTPAPFPLPDEDDTRAAVDAHERHIWKRGER